MNEIRVIYSELKGYLREAPTIADGVIYEEALWSHVNNAIDELSKVTGKDYGRYKTEPKLTRYGSGRKLAVTAKSYRAKLAGLIEHLHAEYFPNEQSPFEERPTSVVYQSQAQQQDQSMHLQIIQDIKSKIEEKLPQHKEGTKERRFLEEVKNSLSSLNATASVISSIKLILRTAKEFGLSIVQVLTLFS